MNKSIFIAIFLFFQTLSNLFHENNNSILFVTVIDKESKKPVNNAIVYLGSGNWKSYTDENGKCVIKDFPYGDYVICVFKKGYERLVKSCNFKKGKNFIKLELKRKEKMPDTVVIEGKIIKLVTAKGTRSENCYFMIVDNRGNRLYIFNDIGENEGFEDYVNKKVKIKGFLEKGFIGWQRISVTGVYVEEIILKE